MKMENAKIYIHKEDSGYEVLNQAIQRGALPGSLIRLSGQEMEAVLAAGHAQVGVVVVKLSGGALIIPRGVDSQPQLPRIALGAEVEFLGVNDQVVSISIRQLQKESEAIIETIEASFDEDMATCLKNKLSTVRKIVVDGHDVWRLELSPMEIVPRGDYLIANRQLLENTNLLSEADRQICLGL